jgi:hypothetical protein
MESLKEKIVQELKSSTWYPNTENGRAELMRDYNTFRDLVLKYLKEKEGDLNALCRKG